MPNPTRPVLRYHGGKWRLAPWIIAHFPAHRVYVEPFGGGGSVLMRKPRADFEVYNDLDADVVNVFRVLRDPAGAAELERVLRLTPWARREFEDSYIPTVDPVERARRTIVRSFMGHGTTSRRKNRTGFRAGSHPNRAGGGFGDWRGYHNAIAGFVDRLTGVVIEERDAFELLRRHDNPDVLFYVDPPYPATVRTSIRGAGDNDRCYTAEMSGDDEHRQLAALLGSLVAAVVVSGYGCDLYDRELYRAWERHEHKARADHGVARMEVIWIKPAGVTMPLPSTHIQGSLLEVPA